ncbi:Not1 N-terminal domain, CCR4-Not complex component family protein [Candida albicans]|uniref:General negative regulator of transcription subunit n=1 Tax=Candida albicans TaxID=5476 RepID=A0A8H6BRZ4_CANAX|nr:Not1 N-terminal domain, CCR4-Not complex component family protein [Candida albicans]
MSARKLQQEFDKLNKKISEGLQAFDEIKDKINATESASQREKLENDLKKELKKLQRSRDQLKQWLGDSSIKLDKNVLQENRTKIEHAMDQFKELEKSSKIKQFSNEGLELQSQQKRSRFGDDAKYQEACTYINEVIEQLNGQNEELEQELDSLSGQSKRKGGSSIQSSIDDVKYKIERNNSHISKLEEVLENLDNDKLDPARIDDIKDDLDYYVENNQDEDYVEYDEFYDQLEVDEEDDVEEEREERKREEKEKEKQQQNPPRTSSSVSSSSSSNQNNIGNNTPPATQIKPSVVTVAAIGDQNNNTPAPPPITSGTSYSNAIKAAQTASTSSTSNSSIAHTANDNNNTNKGNRSVSPLASTDNHTHAPAAVSTPVKVLPPGLNHDTSMNSTLRSESSSPLVGHAKVNNNHELQISRSQSPMVSNENKVFSDTISRIVNVAHSRLNDPLPLQSITGLLETSLLNCPDSYDAEKPRQYNPVNVHPSSIDYPQEPMYELNSSHYMKKFDNDTLFFCFYYGDGIDSISKYNAAKELSRRGWVFNTEFSQWFSKDSKNGGKNRSMSVIQREEENGNIIGDNSNGNEELREKIDDNGGIPSNYKYFDYEKTWLTRRRENYQFATENRQIFQ